MKRLTFLKGMSLVPVLGLLSGIRITEDNPFINEVNLIKDGWRADPKLNGWVRKDNILMSYRSDGNTFIHMIAPGKDGAYLTLVVKDNAVLMKTIRNMYNTLVQSYNT